jgi:hypothetical protein
MTTGFSPSHLTLRGQACLETYRTTGKLKFLRPIGTTLIFEPRMTSGPQWQVLTIDFPTQQDEDNVRQDSAGLRVAGLRTLRLEPQYLTAQRVENADSPFTAGSLSFEIAPFNDSQPAQWVQAWLTQAPLIIRLTADNSVNVSYLTVELVLALASEDENG